MLYLGYTTSTCTSMHSINIGFSYNDIGQRKVHFAVSASVIDWIKSIVTIHNQKIWIASALILPRVQ